MGQVEHVGVQAPGFYERLGYVEYGREVDYPPGHVNYLMRKDLAATR